MLDEKGKGKSALSSLAVKVSKKTGPYVQYGLKNADLEAVLAETDKLLKGQSPLARWRAGAFDAIEDALLL